MHPFFHYFNRQHHSFRHLAVQLYPSSPTKAISCQACLIPLLQCPSHWSPSFLLVSSSSSSPLILTRANLPNSSIRLQSSRNCFILNLPPGAVLIMLLPNLETPVCHCLSILCLSILNLQQDLASCKDPLLSKFPPAKMPTVRTWLKCHLLQQAFLQAS